MWILVIFGDNVEDRIGSGRFFVFYILGGLVAGLLQYAVQPSSTIPSIGASGAIAAVLGAYFFYFPKARVLTLIPIFIIPWIVEIPAVTYLGFWFVTQLFSGVLSITSARGVEAGGIAWWAHIGGFIFGVLLAYPFSLRRRQPRNYPDQYWPW
jgi:membrane associated rhomboid family serine protease